MKASKERKTPADQKPTGALGFVRTNTLEETNEDEPSRGTRLVLANG